MPLPAGAALGVALVSESDDKDPRLIEQPHSAIAINAISAEAGKPGREAPETVKGTGMGM